MFLLRRTAARAISSTPSRAAFIKPRSISSITSAPWRSRQQQQQWISPLSQRRFASDEPAKTETAETETAETKIVQTETAQVEDQASDNFAQTAAEAPVDESITPAQESAQTEPTNASTTVGAEALEIAAENAQAGRRTTRNASRLRGSTNPPNNTIYVGNLYYEVTSDQLQRVFSRFGSIKSVKIIYDNRGLSRGFGYIEFENVNDAQSAVDNLDMQVFEGRNLVVQFHRARNNAKTASSGRSPEPNSPTKTLFIGNMSFEMSDKDLNDLFRDIRNVIDVRVAIDRRTGQPRGFAHADFIDVASATKAMTVLKEKVIYGRQLRVDFSKSGTQQQREAKPEN